MSAIKKKKKSSTPTGRIRIDPTKNLVFDSEEEVYSHFEPQILVVEKEFQENRRASDIDLQDFPDFDDQLEATLLRPDEVWEDKEILPDAVVRNYILRFQHKDEILYYVAVAYVAGSRPTFVYLHFPTNDTDLVDRYRKGTLIFDRAKGGEGPETFGDALSEGDEYAVGLFQALQKVRGESDIPESEFADYLRFRDETLESPDEVWRDTDSQGHVLVTFIREYATDEVFSYVVVTVEENVSESHYLLFSFPTKDNNLVDRFRHGESLHTEEATKEESH